MNLMLSLSQLVKNRPINNKDNNVNYDRSINDDNNDNLLFYQ